MYSLVWWYQRAELGSQSTVQAKIHWAENIQRFLLFWSQLFQERGFEFLALIQDLHLLFPLKAEWTLLCCGTGILQSWTEKSDVGPYTLKTFIALRSVGPGDFPLSDGPAMEMCVPVLSQWGSLWASAHRREWKIHKCLIIYKASRSKFTLQGKMLPRTTMIKDLVGFWKPICAQVDIFPLVLDVKRLRWKGAISISVTLMSGTLTAPEIMFFFPLRLTCLKWSEIFNMWVKPFTQQFQLLKHHPFLQHVQDESMLFLSLRRFLRTPNMWSFKVCY